jgi:hypothetical protein
MAKGFLPVTPQEVKQLGWEQPDFVYVTGDAYVDHPSFGLAIISRVLEKNGYKVAMLPQPNWQTCEDFKLLVGEALEGLTVDVPEVFTAFGNDLSAKIGDLDLVISRVGALGAFFTLDIALALELFERYRDCGGTDLKAFCKVLLGGCGFAFREVHKHSVLSSVYACGGGIGIHADADRPAVYRSAVHDVCHYEGVHSAMLGTLAWRLSRFSVF